MQIVNKVNKMLGC